MAIIFLKSCWLSCYVDNLVSGNTADSNNIKAETHVPYVQNFKFFCHIRNKRGNVRINVTMTCVRETTVAVEK
jgi:hypothetical protein